MRIEVQNFGSYKEFSFNFSNLGLSLLFGETGSGKSTIQDMIAWTLYGVTAKNGSVDEVRNWDDLDTPTIGILDLDHVTVIRVRGSSSQNDLYWMDPNSILKRRGKDLFETQALLEKRINISREVFFTGSYFNEFSPAGKFFTDTAKNRRALFEKIADLSFPQNLSVKLLNKRKENKILLKNLELELAREEGSLSKSKKTLDEYKKSAVDWSDEHENKVLELQARINTFDKEMGSKVESLITKRDHFDKDKQLRLYSVDNKMRILREKISDERTTKLEEAKRTLDGLEREERVCQECGGDAHSGNKQNLLKTINKLEKLQSIREQQIAQYYRFSADHIRIHDEVNPYHAEIETAQSAENIYSIMLVDEVKKVNPFNNLLKNLHEFLLKSSSDVETLRTTKNNLIKEISGLTNLTEMTTTLRGLLLENAVKEVESEANRIIETFFDGAFRITLALSGDDLDVLINKNGSKCSFTQLSKGQRQILKLSYSVAIMKKTASENGVTLPILMFDEALDGLDHVLKVKAYSLFSELELTYPSILLIDHSSELQNLFHRKFHVSLINGHSEVEECE